MKKILSLSIFSLILISACAPAPTIDTETETPMMEEETPSEEANEVSEAAYLDYSPEVLSQSLASDGQTLLFFHAGWCPTCRSAENEILDNPEELPADLSIIKIDYDSEDELKEQYDIATQHTFILVNSDGSEAKRWVGGGLAAIKQQVNS